MTTPLQQAAQQALSTLESGVLLCEVTAASMLRAALADEQAQAVEPCKGKNCGTTNPKLHSSDCFDQHEITIGDSAPFGYFCYILDDGEGYWRETEDREGTPLYTHSSPPPPTTRPPTPPEKSELLAAGVTGECVRVLAFNDRPKPEVGERESLISRADESIAALNSRIMEPFYCSIDQDAIRVLIDCMDALEPSPIQWMGVMGDGTLAPENSDEARLDWISLHPGKVINLKSGVLAKDINTEWQPSVRAATDAAMEFMRRDLRSSGLRPTWQGVKL